MSMSISIKYTFIRIMAKKEDENLLAQKEKIYWRWARLLFIEFSPLLIQIAKENHFSLPVYVSQEWFSLFRIEFRQFFALYAIIICGARTVKRTTADKYGWMVSGLMDKDMRFEGSYHLLSAATAAAGASVALPTQLLLCIGHNVFSSSILANEC